MNCCEDMEDDDKVKIYYLLNKKNFRKNAFVVHVEELLLS